MLNDGAGNRRPLGAATVQVFHTLRLVYRVQESASRAGPMTIEYFRLVDRAQSDKLIEQAQRSDRRRAHMLLHQDHSDPVQRLLVAFVEGTYVQPHCHPEQWEMDIPLRGEFKLLIFSPEGTVLRRQELRPGDTDVAQVPAGVWHTIIAAAPTALMLEAKPGPYRPAQFATWAPGETDPRSGVFVTRLATALPGMSLGTFNLGGQ